MRHMTPTELNYWYERHEWPCGHGSRDNYFPGPRGGICRNVTCLACSLSINVIDPLRLDLQFVHIGQVVEEPSDYTPPQPPPRRWYRRALDRICGRVAQTVERRS